MHSFSTGEIQELYRQHPLRQNRILARVLAQRGSVDGITERDLAEDSITEITDQNHVGGTQFVAELARKCEIDAATCVLDLGCGLGGAARYLAYSYGCRVHGVDLSPERCAEAEFLTKLVDLQHLVTFELGDMMQLNLEPSKFDVLWDQGSWVHLPDKKGLIQRWAPFLRSGGRIAMEDAYLKRMPDSPPEIERLEALEQSWMSPLVGQEVWIDAVGGENFAIETVEDLSSALHEYSNKLIDIEARSHSNGVTEAEKTGWYQTIQLIESGVLGYFRIVARKNS